MFQFVRPSRLALQGAAIAVLIVLLMSCLRPLGVLFLGLLIYWLYRTRCSFRIVPTPQLRANWETLLQSGELWRQESPITFCVMNSIGLGTFAYLGHLVSGAGLVLILLVLAVLFSSKYNFKLFQIERKDFQWSEQMNYSNVEAELNDEFMPDVNDESNMFVLERASDVATISSPNDNINDEDGDERSDEIPSELLIPDIIPEVDEHSTDEEDELVPHSHGKKNVDHRPTEANSQQQSTVAKAMDFRQGHFKRDSSLSSTSSSSDENLSKGLKFPDHNIVDAAPSNAQQMQPTDTLMTLAVKAQAQALLPSLMSGLVNWGANQVDSTDATTTLAKYQRRQVTALDSSDESDFEILETDDFK